VKGALGAFQAGRSAARRSKDVGDDRARCIDGHRRVPRVRCTNGVRGAHGKIARDADAAAQLEERTAVERMLRFEIAGFFEEREASLLREILRLCLKPEVDVHEHSLRRGLRCRRNGEKCECRNGAEKRTHLVTFHRLVLTLGRRAPTP
jgi:hypothetical protein